MSCSDNNDDVNAPFAITQSDAVYGAAGGEGTITVNSLYGVKTVSSSDDWCIASFGGNNTVALSVAANPSEESRSAVVKISDNNGEEVRLAVSQQGCVYELEDDKEFSFGYNDSTITVGIAQKNIDADLKASADWLTARQEGGNIVVHVAANNTGTWRAGTVYCQFAGVSKDSIMVVQAEAKDIYGDYYMTGEPYDVGQVHPTVTRVSIAPGDSANQIKFTWTDIGFSCDYSFNADSIVFKMETNANHPIGYKRFVSDGDYMAYGNTTVNVMSIIWAAMRGINGWYYGRALRNYSPNLNVDVYLSAIGNKVVWRLKSNSSLQNDIELNGIFVQNDYEHSFYPDRGVYISVKYPYIIPADKYTPTAE